MAQKTQNFDFNFDYDLSTDTYQLFVSDNDANWQALDSSVGRILSDVEAAGIILPTPTTIGTETDYFKYPSKIAELKTRLYNILVSKGVSASAGDTLNTLIEKVNTYLEAPTDLIALVDGSVVDFVNPTDNLKIAAYKFYKNYIMETATLNLSDTSKTIEIGSRAFAQEQTYNSKLTTVSSNANLNVGAYAFNKDNKLTTFTCGGTITVNEYSFAECSSLETIIGTINNYNSLPSRTFYSCTSLKDATFGTDLYTFNQYCCYQMGKNANTSNIEIIIPLTSSYYGYYQNAYFYSNSFYQARLKKLQCDRPLYFSSSTNVFKGIIAEYFSAAVEYGTSFPNNAFENTIIDNFSLSRVPGSQGSFSKTMPTQFFQGATIKALTTSDVFYAFNSSGAQFKNFTGDSTNLTSLEFDSFTGTSIPTNCFNGAKNVFLNLPSTITSIESSAFVSISNFYLKLNSTPSLINGAFDNATNYKIYINYSSMDSLKIATNWASYSSNIFGFINGTIVIENYGGVFPTVSPDNQDSITWYTDVKCTTLAITPERGVIYYCNLNSNI